MEEAMPEPDWKQALRDWVAVAVGGSGNAQAYAFDSLLPHIAAAYKRGHDAGRSRAGYRLVTENERLRRELELARREKNGASVCPTCLSALSATESGASAGEPPEGAAP
jgi:hypothetical protein